MTDRSERRRSAMAPSSPSGTADSSKEAKGLRLSELHEVCATGDADKLEEMLKAGKFESINYKDPDWSERTPLHWCCMLGKGDMVRRLIDKGAHPGLRSTSGWTAAHFAAESGKTNVLRVLHQMNSPMDRMDLYGDSPKRIAQIYGHKEATDFLNVAEREYREKRIQNERSGEVAPHDDEDKEWCQKNNIKPVDYVPPEELLALESFRSMQSAEASPKRSRKALHYGKDRAALESKKPGRSPKTTRRRPTESKSPHSKGADKKSARSPSGGRRNSKQNSASGRVNK